MSDAAPHAIWRAHAGRAFYWTFKTSFTERLDEVDLRHGSQTVAGTAAKARAAMAEACAWPDGREVPEGTLGENWAWDLVRDLLEVSAAVPSPKA